MPDLPVRPVSSDQKLLAAVVRRLDTQNELLTQILDRLPEPPAPVGGTETVELREPDPPTAAEPAPRARPTAPRARKPKATKEN